MSYFTLHSVTGLQVTLRASRQAVAAGAHRVVERFRREQTGQDVLEYSGLIVFVALAVGLLFSLHIPTAVSTAVVHAMNSVFSEGKTAYTAPTLTSPTGG